MNFNDHRRLEGSHAFISASTYHWLNYDDDKFVESMRTKMAAALGTRLHDLAKNLIELRQKLPKTPKTLHLYVNDCIGFDMVPEQVLFYSIFAYGTADAIKFIERNPKTGRPLLRIFDLKTGVNEASFKQLVVYAAFFCLEYHHRPGDIDIELRIYQNDDVRIEEANPIDVVNAMDKIIRFDSLIQDLKEAEAA